MKDIISFLPILFFSAFAVYILLFKPSKYTIRSYSSGIFRHYRPLPRLMSSAEIVLYRVITKHLSHKYIIAPKVRLADFVHVKSHIKKGPMSKSALFARIGQKHADFLITTTDTSKPILWIELDDRSHNSASARKADKFKDDLAASINIPLKRIKTGENYNHAMCVIIDELVLYNN